MDALRVRLEEKETFLTKKTKQLQDLSDEKSTLTGEGRDLKDMLEVKERKVNVLQKKVRWAGTHSVVPLLCWSHHHHLWSRSKTSWNS